MANNYNWHPFNVANSSFLTQSIQSINQSALLICSTMLGKAHDGGSRSTGSHDVLQWVVGLQQQQQQQQQWFSYSC